MNNYNSERMLKAINGKYASGIFVREDKLQIVLKSNIASSNYPDALTYCVTRIFLNRPKKQYFAYISWKFIRKWNIIQFLGFYKGQYIKAS